MNCETCEELKEKHEALTNLYHRTGGPEQRVVSQYVVRAAENWKQHLLTHDKQSEKR